MAFGTLIESFLGFRAEALRDELRREMWSLAHFHGAMLGLINIVYARYAQQSLASSFLIAGSLLMPFGFLTGGMWHPEGDPGIGIVLVPIGALCVIIAAGERAAAAWRRNP